MKSKAIRLAIAAAMTATAFLGQSNTGSIQGTVVGSDGTPLSGVRVYAAVKAATQKTKAPPTVVAYVQNGATAQPNGKPPISSPANSFVIPNLPPVLTSFAPKRLSPDGWTPATGRQPCRHSAWPPAKVSPAEPW